MNTAIAPQPQLSLALPTPTPPKRKKIGKTGFVERTALAPNGDLNLWPHNMPWDSTDKAYEHILHNAKPGEFYYITRAVETVRVEVNLNRQAR